MRIDFNSLGPAELFSIKNFGSKIKIQKLIFLTVGDLLCRSIIISNKFQSKFQGIKGINYFLKLSEQLDRPLKSFEKALLTPLNPQSWISLKEYSYKLANFCIDPLMYTASYNYQKLVNDSLLNQGFIARKRSWYFLSSLQLTPLGKAVKKNEQVWNFESSWPPDLYSLRTEFESDFESKILYSNSAMSQFNRAEYPTILRSTD